MSQSASSLRRFFLLASLTAAACAVLAAPALADTASFSYAGGEQSWTVPAGTYSIEVEAVGGRGGNGREGGGTGGRAAVVTGTLAVTPGQTLYVEVGGIGSSSVNSKSFNGGGEGSNNGAAGGGATDLRTVPRSGDLNATLSSRLLVAAGGGGGGGGATAAGGAGGDEEAAGLSGSGVANGNGGSGGGGATTSAGGSAGAGGSGSCCDGGSGEAGLPGYGGNSDNTFVGAGGGGGGGVYGGGAGGTGGRSSQGQNAGGGGGGGGSNLVPTGGTAVLATSARQPSLSIQYSTRPAASIQQPTALSPESVQLFGTAEGFGNPVSAHFEYGLTPAYGTTTPESAREADVFASTVVSGLKPSTTYYFRLVAIREDGTRAVSSGVALTLPAPAPVVAPVTPDPVTAAPAIPAPVVTPTTPAPAVTHCVVPNLRAKKLAAAKKALGTAHCALGKVKEREGTTVATGKVVAQATAPGKILTVGTRIGVTLK